VKPILISGQFSQNYAVYTVIRSTVEYYAIITENKHKLCGKLISISRLTVSIVTTAI